ncbi:MAG TPA: acyltransferase [Baekduia sp.]|nr:acyltransferase [Baekduia sp.]
MGMMKRLLDRLRGGPDVARLQRDGLTLGRRVTIERRTHIDPDFPWLIAIGDETVVSFGVTILAHDASTRRPLGYTRVAPVSVGARVFIGAGAIILPGVTIGDDAIVGAGSVVRRDVAPGTVVGGNPARPLLETASYLARHRERMARRPTWPKRGWTLAGEITPDRKREMAEVLLDGEAYVE